jgi:polysaccharide deacetylase family sporulation protein PdaB
LGGGFKLLNVFLNTQKEIPIYSVDTKEKKIALTFDASFGTDFTDRIIDILDKNKVTATFFLVGGWVDKNPEMVKKLFASGYEIGNHSNTHPHFTELSKGEIKAEINLTRDKIKKLIGIDSPLFRLPFGEYNSSIIKNVLKTKSVCIQWDVDSKDSDNVGTYFIYNNVAKHVDNGSIILFHTNAEQTPLVLDRIVKELKASGYEFVKVSQLVYPKDYYIDHTGRQRLLE